MIPQPNPVPAGQVSERLRAGLSHRAIGIIAALAIEGLLLLLLLTLGRMEATREEEMTFVEFKAIDTSDTTQTAEETAESADPEPQVIERAVPQSAEAQEQAVPPQAITPPPPAVVPPRVPIVRQPDPRYGVGPRPIQNPPPAGPAAGPANTGSASGDSERVGTAPNGEPLYAASWYRKPYDDELRGYLSSASGPGWGLIACRTAPDYRVEDCVGLDESPRGSMIMRSVLAAAWQFKVRPPRIGGRPQVGEWVRIRIDYNLRPAE